MKITNEVLFTEITNIKEGQERIFTKIDDLCKKSEDHTTQIAEIKLKQNIIWGIIGGLGMIIGGTITTLYLKIFGGK